MDTLKRLFLILLLSGLPLPQRLQGQAEAGPNPVVHAILFYSPTCPHCHEVIQETLIPLQNQYGNRLVILGLDTTQDWASNLYWEAVRHFQLPEEEWVVPILVVGEEVLVGGFEIPNRLPGIIEEGLVTDGIDLPNFPALVTFAKDRDLLDPRFPDRLIARQSSSQEEEQPPAEGDSLSGSDPIPGDSLDGEATPTPEESVAVGAAAGAGDQPRERSVDSTQSPSAGPEGGRLGDPGPPSSETAVQGGPEAQSDAGRTGSAEPESEGPESERPEADLVDPLAPSSSGFQVHDSSGPALGSLGLADAAQEMESRTMWDRFGTDPTGNSLSVLVLLGMVLSLGLRGFPPRVRGGEWPSWVIPTLVLVGAGVAGYLSFIEVTQAPAVCGPVGDCNTVNQSEYASLFGVLPVGILGLVGYGVMMVLWVLSYSGSGRLPRVACLGLWFSALLGTVFSIYLTFLEPFVIGATCIWCLTSAVVITLLLWATGPRAARVWFAVPPASITD